MVFEKVSFSMMEEPSIKNRFLELYLEGTSVILFGVLTEACVLQTVISMRQMGVRRIIVVDEATQSLEAGERETAMKRISDLGVAIV